MRRGLRIRAKITFIWTFGPHTHTARITVFRRRRSFPLTTIIFLTTLKNANVVMRRGLMCLLQTVLLTFVALFQLQLAYLLSVNKVNWGGFELFGLFGQV